MPALSRRQLAEIVEAATARGGGAGISTCRTFVETGTGLGHTAVQMAGHFEEVHTIEIKQEFVHAARLMAWKAEGPIHFYHGSTEHVLPALLPRVRGPAVVFLDAHFSGEGTGRGERDVPLVDELTAIDQLMPHAALVIVDDLRLFGRGGSRDDLDVDWSGISRETLDACIRPRRLACAFALEAEDRYVFCLRPTTEAGLRGTSGGGARSAASGTGLARQLGLRCSQQSRGKASTDGFVLEPFVSDAGGDLDGEAHTNLCAAGTDFQDLARTLLQEYSLAVTRRSVERAVRVEVESR